MNRRDFLRPRQIGSAAGQILQAFHPLASAPAASSELGALVRARRRAMATDFEIILPFGIERGLEAAEAGLGEIDRVEEQITVYRDSSEVCDVNRRAADEEVVVSPELFDLLTLAARITNETQSAFDVTAGALVKAWGFYRRRGRVPSPDERAQVLQRTGMCHIRFDPQSRSVRYLRPGVEINFGSIGKGYALDRVAGILRGRWKINGGLLHGGHSSVYAIGDQPGAGRGWAISLKHPWEPERRLGVLRLRNRGLATSAATFQHLEYNGRRLGHVLDPRTGWPAEGISSATAVAPTAAEADALSTAFFVLGVDATRAYCEAHPDVGAVLLTDDDAPIVLGLASDEISLSR
jgi:thiamine biosynthesis lipoprotein